MTRKPASAPGTCERLLHRRLDHEQTNIRVLFVFDPWQSAILLVAGDKTGQWRKWYEVAVPQAEQLFALYLKERAKAEEKGHD